MIRIGVVIPARNEEARVDACLRSVAAAIAEARAVADVSVTVVADDCTDATEAIVASHPFVHLLRSRGANVGLARAVGAQREIAHGCTWLAHTDADSVVPPGWIREHAQAAAAGVDVLIGTVRPDFRELAPAQIAHWNATHHRGRPNGHVHGANLGVRVSRYLEAGGFLPMLEHEDNDLVDRMRAIGAITIASDRAEVVTSGRLVGRTSGGYAGHLRAIRDALVQEAGEPAPGAVTA